MQLRYTDTLPWALFPYSSRHLPANSKPYMNLQSSLHEQLQGANPFGICSRTNPVLFLGRKNNIDLMMRHTSFFYYPLLAWTAFQIISLKVSFRVRYQTLLCTLCTEHSRTQRKIDCGDDRQWWNTSPESRKPSYGSNARRQWTGNKPQFLRNKLIL